MAAIEKRKKEKVTEMKVKITWKEIKRQKALLIWSAFIVLYGVIFCYLPLGGWLMAFQNYRPKDGLLHSQFVGLAKFQQLFSDATFLRVIRNTLAMGVINLVATFFMAILFAILLNDVKSQGGKKVVQTISYLPHFLSWVVIGAVAYQMFATQSGVVNALIANAGKSPIPFLQEDGWWLFSYVLIGVWQTMGWGTIIYLAAITNVNSELYEAAKVDGANRWQQCLHVTLPCIRSTIVVMLIMQLGKLMGGSFERIVALSNAKATEFTTTIPVLVYKWFQGNKFSESTALGLFQSVIGVILVIASDRVAKKLGEDGLL